MKSSMFQEWLLYGCLFCPNELSSNVRYYRVNYLRSDTLRVIEEPVTGYMGHIGVP